MTESNRGIGNVVPNQGLVEMAMAYSRSRVLCAAARLGVADALADEVRGVSELADACQAQRARMEDAAECGRLHADGCVSRGRRQPGWFATSAS